MPWAYEQRGVKGQKKLMNIIRFIVYASTAAHDSTTLELGTLLIDAQAFNLKHDVTGVLL